MKNLIIGGSSNLGNHIINSSSKNYDFTYFKNKKKNGIFFNLLDLKKNSINYKNYKSIIILSAISNPYICHENKDYSNKVNVEATIDLIKYISDQNVKLIFFSSEFIYDGKKGNYNEFDDPNPLNLYGDQKLQVENFIKKNVEKFSILRVAKTYTTKLNDSSFLSFIYSEILKKKKKEISIIDDEYFSPLNILDLINTVNYLIDNDIDILNVGGPQKKSRLDCLKKFLEINNVSSVNIRLFQRKITKNSVIIPKDVSFNTNKIRDILGNMITIDNFLKDIYKLDEKI